jgi:hypothetical protein
MINRGDISQDKTIGDLAHEAAWFLAHTLIAVILLALAIGVISLNDPDPDSSTPKLMGTILALMFPMVGSFFLARIHHNNVAGHVWISGFVLFSIVCVWLIGMPTGRGLCETCGPVEKLWRTLFTFSRGSGLMGGDGLLVGAWTPLSMIGYAIGAKLAL